MKKEEVPQNISAFPLGKENTGFKQYFTGESWLAPLTGNKDLNVPMSNVTFEPGCRNNWHSHTGGQILIAVGGVGYYQERGKAARRLLPGDVVEIAPDIEHWHGAAPDSWFSHLAIGCNPQTNKNIWLEQVDDQQYAEATKDNGGTGLSATDPELDAIFGNFTKEVQQYGNLDTKTRLMVTLASNIASQAQTEYRMMLESALNAGITPIEIKEILYQAVAYAGMAKVMDFVGITNEALLAHGVRLPLEGQAVESYVLLAMPFIYPMVSLARGLSFPEMTSPVMPCSVVVFTIGLLLLFAHKVNMFLVLFLCHWSLIGLSKTYFFQIPEDFLLASATIPGLYLFFREYFLNNLHADTKPKAKYINWLLITVCIGLAILLTTTMFLELVPKN